MMVEPPGATISSLGPKLEKLALVSLSVRAPTAITSRMLAGLRALRSSLEFPAEKTTTVPNAYAYFTASSNNGFFVETLAPQLLLITSAPLSAA